MVRGDAKLLIATATLFVALGCGKHSSLDGDGDAGVPPDAGPDLSDELFQPDVIVEVAIELPESDWDALRTETRDFDILLGDDCLDEPFGSPFTYRSGTVTVNGERLENVGVRKKGFLGSLDDDKPSIKIKFDEYVADQELLGLDRLTLNNNRQDPAMLRQCITYDLFAKAGVPAPRCNFAHVTVNGRDMGVYTHVETVKKRFLRRHFEDNDGRLYEGTLSDFRAGWSGTFEAKTNKEDPDRSDIAALEAALELPDGQLLSALEPLLDIDRFIDFWAMEVLTAHTDGYANNTNNFFVYNDPTTGLLEFLPWGVDNTLHSNEDFAPGEDPPRSVFATGMLARRLYRLPSTRDRYVSRMREILDEVWNESELTAELDRIETLLAPISENDPFLEDRDLSDEIDTVRDFVRDRRGQIESELDAPPPWDYDLRDSFCFGILGDIQASFDTTYGTLGSPDVFAAGSGTITGSVDGATITTMQVGSVAGPNDDEPGQSVVQVIAQVSATTFIFAMVSATNDSFSPGASVPLGLDTNFAFLFEYDAVTETGDIVAMLWDGTLTFSAASLQSGQPVVGSFSGTLVESPF